jgi:hypothetical protein
MTKPHSESFEQKMVQRLMGRDAVERFAVGQGDRSPAAEPVAAASRLLKFDGSCRPKLSTSFIAT